jgi:hypothetical protein
MNIDRHTTAIIFNRQRTIFINRDTDFVGMTRYTAQSLEVLSGLDPVRRRPGMYTDTTRPNHLAHGVRKEFDH